MEENNSLKFFEKKKIEHSGMQRKKVGIFQ